MSSHRGTEHAITLWKLMLSHKKGILLVGSLLARRVRHATTKVLLQLFFLSRWQHGNGCYNANDVLVCPLYLLCQMCCIYETLPSSSLKMISMTVQITWQIICIWHLRVIKHYFRASMHFQLRPLAPKNMQMSAGTSSKTRTASHGKFFMPESQHQSPFLYLKIKNRT